MNEIMALDLSTLNAAQRDAVTAPDGPTLIVAGPGTGKTHTLAHRIAYLRQRSQPTGILAVTFTQKAAREMTERTARLNGGDGYGDTFWIGTFHRLGLTLLRREGHRIGIGPDAHILSGPEQASLIKAVLNDVVPEEPGNQFRRWSRRLSVYKQCGLSVGEFDELSMKVLSVYENRLRAFNALDYDDLIVKALTLFQEAPSVLEQLRNRFSAILVDEYQDINDGQYQFIKELCGDNANLWVIGDADQAIYAFRGAQVEYFLRFTEDFPDTVTINLEKNYRSTPIIVQGARAVINHNDYRMPCTLVPTCHGGDDIRILRSADEKAEARFVVSEIKGLVGGISMEATGEGEAAYGFDDIAILYRLHALSRGLVKAMEQAGIPCQVVGGTDSPEDSVLETLLPFLKAVANPHDDNAIKALLPKIDRRLGFAAVTNLAQGARGAGISLYAYLSAADGTIGGDGIRAETVLTTLSTLAWYHHESVRISLRVLLDGVYENLFNGDAAHDGARLELGALAEPFAQGAASEHLGRFLESVALWTEGETYNPHAEAVTLMSVHGAKGLEFPVVFVVGLEDGIFPCDAFGDGPSDREEERRLFYVAMTRAKRRLYLSSAQERRLFGEKRRNSPSPFLKEIPAELVMHVREKGTGAKKPRVKQKSFF